MEFPQLKAWLRLPGERKDVSIYDVKFYPYSELHEDAVFAAVAGREVFVCKPIAKSSTAKTDTLEFLTVLEDPDENVSLNSIAWSRDADTGDPLLCVAGSGSKRIKILNVVTGKLVRVLQGHGGDINDLVISPTSPDVLASCSSDYTIRIWNLNTKYEKQPCAAILAGEGHRQSILSIHFHANGRWLLSGGQDTMVCLWTVPNIPDENAGTDNPTIVHYPHFASIGVHSDYVDCVRFWGDLILSKASEGNNASVKRGEILLWKIQGFSSSSLSLASNPLPEPPMPTHGLATRSAFGGTFQRLLTFDMMHINPFYMRFGLLQTSNLRPMLAMGNIKARFSFWDIQKIEEGHQQQQQQVVAMTTVGGDEDSIVNAASASVSSASSVVTANNASNTTAKKRKRGLAESVLANSTRASSAASSSTVTRASSTNTSTKPLATALTTLHHKQDPNTANNTTNTNSSIITDRKSTLSTPYARLAAHKMTVVPCPVDFACRAVEWSLDGRWCVGVGDYGMIAIFGRVMKQQQQQQQQQQ